MEESQAVFPAPGPQGLLFRGVSPFGGEFSIRVVGLGVSLCFYARMSSSRVSFLDVLS